MNAYITRFGGDKRAAVSLTFDDGYDMKSARFFNDEMKIDYENKHLFLRSRFSPGYGDLGLEMQKDIFAVLDCPRKIGLSLNESLLMSPSKSVTAIIGISNVPKTCKPDNCASCAKSDCTFRR